MDEAVKAQVISILEDVNDLTVATVRGDGWPQATTVSFVNDGLRIYFGTAADAQKAQNIAANNKVSLKINRSYDSWGEIEGISASGVASLVVDEQEKQKIGNLIFAKFPHLAEYFPAETSTEDLALFRIDLSIISLLDYRKGFGHCNVISV